MDPVSLSLGIAGVLPLVATAIKHAEGYVTSVLAARKSIAALVTELKALQSSLTSLQMLLEQDAAESTGLHFSQGSILVSCLNACETKVRELCRKLELDGSSKMRRLVWPLSEKERQKTIQELRTCTTWMQFALSIDGRGLLSQTSDSVLKILGAQLEQIQTINALGDQTIQLKHAVERQGQRLEDDIAARTRSRILEWISTTNYNSKHRGLQSTRTEGTGAWLLGEPRYQEWRDGIAGGNVLWCHGIQGSGKTNLTSIVVDDLLVSVSEPLAFFYFDHQEQEAQSLSTVWFCILRQLVERMPQIPQSVSDLYAGFSKSSGSLSLSDCERIVLDLAKDLERSYFIFDALDELIPLSSRQNLLRRIAELSQVAGVRILVTSRPHVEDITTALKHHAKLEIVARQEDIRKYIGQKLAEGGFDVTDDPELANRLVETLVQKADGMFLLPVIQLPMIIEEPSHGEMEDKLSNLSDTLAGAFEETLARIQSLHPTRSRLGMSILMHVTHAKRPLTVSELGDVLALPRVKGTFDTRYRPPLKVILDCCQGLVMVDMETSHVKVAHYAVQEYLVQNQESLFPEAEKQMALSCLKFLCLENFQSGPWYTEQLISASVAAYPFLAYAAENWGRHAKTTEALPEVRQALSILFSSRPAIAVANQVRQYLKNYNEHYWNPNECLSFSALHHAARWGLEGSIRVLLDQGDYQVNQESAMGATAAIQAAANGRISTLRILLERGANPRRRNWYGNALHCAIEAGQSEAIRELAAWGMLSRITGAEGSELLYCAIDRDQAGALETLIELGVEQESYETRQLFFDACINGCEKIVQLMIQRKWVSADEIHASTRQSPVHMAALATRPGALKKLIDAGADVNVFDWEGRSPLDCARESENLAAERLLLAAGAVPGEPVDRRDSEGSGEAELEP